MLPHAQAKNSGVACKCVYLGLSAAEMTEAQNDSVVDAAISSDTPDAYTAFRELIASWRPLSLAPALIKTRLSQLGPTADGSAVAFLNLLLDSCSLSHVSALSQFSHVQRLDLSRNKLLSLSELEPLRSLIHLTVEEVCCCVQACRAVCGGEGDAKK